MAAFGIGTELDFIDHKACDLDVERHRFDSADKIARVGRNDLLFAGDESGSGCAFETDDFVVDLASEQAQWQADHAGAMGQHPLDGKVCLAGIGWAEDGSDAPGFCRATALFACRCHVTRTIGNSKPSCKRRREGGF